MLKVLAFGMQMRHTGRRQRRRPDPQIRIVARVVDGRVERLS